MSYQAVEWAIKKAPMLLTEKGKPDTTARHVLAVLAECAQADGSEARPSLMTLQYRTGYDRRTIQRALRRLEDGRMIRAEGSKYGCTVYRLPLELLRPETDLKELEVEEERRQEADAERQRRSRARRVTHSGDVTVTDAECVTDDLEGGDVTHADDVSHALSVPTSRILRPDVTHGTPPYPSLEPSGESSLSSAPPSPAAEQPSATSERENEAAPDKPTAAQRTVRSSGVVNASEEQTFIAWMEANNRIGGPGWWNRVAENGHLPDHAAAWRKAAPRAAASTTGAPGAECWICTRVAAPPILHGGHSYCTRCCAPCSSCRASIPMDALDDDTNRCSACRAHAAA